MSTGTQLADRLVQQLFGGKRELTPEELASQKPASPPRSVKSQLEDVNKQRAESRRLMRNVRSL